MEQGKVTGALASFIGEDAHIWLSIYCVEAVWIVAINVIAIIALSTNRRFFTKAVYMLINLAVSDMLFGCAVFVLCLYILLGSSNTRGKHSFLVALISFCITASGTNVVVVAVDRLFATFFPFRFNALSSQYYYTFLGINWSLCLSLAICHYVLPSKNAHILAYFYAFIIVLSLLVITSSYIAIFIKVRSQGQLSNRNAQSARLRDRNMAYTAMIVTLCSVLAWLPLVVVFVLNQRTNIYVPSEISFCAIIVQASNSFLNPVIYTLRLRRFRKALFQLICRCAMYRVYPMS